MALVREGSEYRRDAHRAEQLLDAALTVLARTGRFSDVPGAKLVTCEVGGVSLRMRGKVDETAKVPGAGSQADAAGRVTSNGPTCAYTMEVSAPSSVFAVG